MVQKSKKKMSDDEIRKDMKSRITVILTLRAGNSEKRQEALAKLFALYKKMRIGVNKDAWARILGEKLKDHENGPANRVGSKFLPLLRFAVPGLKEHAYSVMAAALDHGRRHKMKNAAFAEKLKEVGYVRLAKLERLERARDRLVRLERAAAAEKKQAGNR